MQYNIFPQATTGNTTSPMALEFDAEWSADWAEARFAWIDFQVSGNIDAPDFIPVGGVKPVIFQGFVEGIVVKTNAR